MATIPNVPHRSRDELPHTWTKVRRVVQLCCLALFAIFPLTHWATERMYGPERIVRETYVQGHFAASSFRAGGFQLHLADPFAAIEVFIASHEVTLTLAIAAGIVLAFYWLLGGRTFCAWACPLGTVLDLAEPGHRWLRKRWHFKTREIAPRLKYQLLAAILLVSALTGLTVFELVSPIFAVSRAIAFGVTSGLVVVGLIVAFEVLVARRGWCESLCPVGAFYGLVGKVSPVRVAIDHDICDECKVCARYCVTPRILDPPIDGVTDAVTSADCTLCGACLDDCPTGALSMQIAFRARRAT
ncbi:MAG: NapH/MauN family ferredoxin-type protein [Nitrospirota bacterium]|jgi:ferredoxin-type protein NapH